MKTDVYEKFLCSKLSNVMYIIYIYSILHTVNETVDIVYNKRLIS